MIKKLSKRSGGSGQSLVEFALVLPFFLVLFMGIVEFGNAWRKYQLVTNTAREGCREAVLPSSTQTSVETRIQDRLDGAGLDSTLVGITLGICSGAGCTGDPDTVSLEYPHDFVLVGPLIDMMCVVAGCDGTAYSTVTLSTSAIMRNE